MQTGWPALYLYCSPWMIQGDRRPLGFPSSLAVPSRLLLPRAWEDWVGNVYRATLGAMRDPGVATAKAASTEAMTGAAGLTDRPLARTTTGAN